MGALGVGSVECLERFTCTDAAWQPEGVNLVAIEPGWHYSSGGGGR